MADVMNHESNQAAASGGDGNDPPRMPNDGNINKGHYAPKKRGGKKWRRELKGKCLHCHREDHRWAFCWQTCEYCGTKDHSAFIDQYGNSREAGRCPVVELTKPGFYNQFQYGQTGTQARDAVMHQTTNAADSRLHALVAENQKLTSRKTALQKLCAESMAALESERAAGWEEGRAQVLRELAAERGEYSFLGAAQRADTLNASRSDSNRGNDDASHGSFSSHGGNRGGYRGRGDHVSGGRVQKPFWNRHGRGRGGRS